MSGLLKFANSKRIISLKGIGIMRHLARLFFILIIIQMALTGCSSPEGDVARLRTLIEEDWEWTLKTYPTYATRLGDKRYNDRLQDLSPEALAANKQYALDVLAKLRKIDDNRLKDQDKLNYALFRKNFENEVAGQAFPVDYMPVNQMGGVQIDLPSMQSFTPFDDLKDYENYLSRMRAMPLYIEQTVDLMRKGIETGWVYPRVPLRSLPGQLQNQFEGSLDDSPFLTPFKDYPDGIGAVDQERLVAEARRILSEEIRPAYSAMFNFVNEEYMPATTDDVGAWALPDGEAYYNYRVELMTTTDMTAEEIHEKGLSEVTRIKDEMIAIARETGFGDDLAAFQKFLKDDPQFYGHTPEQRINGYIEINDRLYEGIPALFGRLPQAKVEVEAMPDYEAPTGPGAYYRQPAPDGSRPGTFFANTSSLDTRASYAMESLTMHEAVPGHHLQIAIAQELEGLPEFRKNGWFVAYGEGWALYAESLGEILGMYRDPYSKYGQLASEIFRAVRLVVDIGMHYKHWTRQQALDYFESVFGSVSPGVISEVDRYIAWPGQALGYKIGQLKIMELRANAESVLGDKFDIKGFHDTVLEQGALPLSILEDQIDNWIEAVRIDG
jgi:uncharacterized protein (DUF885 family)